MTKKTCFKCGRNKELRMFYKHPMMADGHLGKCIHCTKKDVRERYYAHPEKVVAYERERARRPERRAQTAEYRRLRKLRNPGKHFAHVWVGNAIRDGRLTPQPCEVCGTTERIEAHHDDYRRPKNVRWLCFKHHREVEHGQRTYTMKFRLTA